MPAKIVRVADIPRTMNNKIAELAVREVIHGRPVKNVDALANPEALELYRASSRARDLSRSAAGRRRPGAAAPSAGTHGLAGAAGDACALLTLACAQSPDARGRSLLAWVLGLALSGVLAWRRERRLEATGPLSDGARRRPPAADRCPSSARSAATSWRPCCIASIARCPRSGRAGAETDRLLATLLDALPDPLLLVGPGRVVANANRAADALFGHDPVAKPLEASLRDPGVLAAVDQALQAR